MTLHHTGGDRPFHTQHRGRHHWDTGTGLDSTPQFKVLGPHMEFSFQVINYSMGMKNPGRQSTIRNANYYGKLPEVCAKCVCTAHSLCPSEGDHKELERKGGWYDTSQQTKEQAGAGMGMVPSKRLIPTSNSCNSPSLYLLQIHISLTYILRAIKNPE